MTAELDAPTGPGPHGTEDDAGVAGDRDVPRDDGTDDGPERSGRPPAPRWYRPGLAAVAVAALAVRLANVLTWRHTCDEDLVDIGRAGGKAVPPQGCFRIWGDSAYSFIQGRLIAEGDWFVDSNGWFESGGRVTPPSSGDPPLFALFLGLLSKLGVTTGEAQRVATCVIGVVGVILIATLTRRLVGPRAALIAGIIAAGYPMLWINDGMLLSESLYVPLIVLAIHAAYSFWEEPDLRHAAWFGIAMALAALTRAEALILLVVMPLPLLWGLRHLAWSARLRLGAVAIGTGLVLIAPWLAFNLTRFNNPALMTSATGAVLSSSNCDITYYTESLGYYGNCFDEYIAKGWMVGKLPGCTDAVAEAVRADPQSDEIRRCWPEDPALDDTDRDKFRSELAIRYMRENKGRLPVVMLARVGRMWDLYSPSLGHDEEPLGQNVYFNWAIEGRGKLASRTGLLAFWALLPFAALGVVALWRRRIPISPLTSMTIVITVTAAATFGVTRYRVPVDAIVVVLAAIGIDALLRRAGSPADAFGLRRRRGRGDAGPGGPGGGDGERATRAGAEALAGIVPGADAASGSSTATDERRARRAEP